MLWLLAHTLAMVVFVNRYISGFLLRRLKGKTWDEVDDTYEPTITVVMPLYNESGALEETLASVLALDYPRDKLHVVCVDDCSTDDSYARAWAIAERSDGVLRVERNPANIGKRASIIRVVRESTSEVIVSIDSDVIVERDAVRQLVRRFARPQIAAVGGWVDVRNKHDNWLTRMQVVKYWYAYYVMKNVELAFKKVMVLSGCLTAYRRSVLVELEPILEARALWGAPVKYGEDRYLTRQIVKAGYLTTLTLDARCRTTVPRTLPTYFAQQLRWRRSNLIDYFAGIGHMWRLHPLIAINYFSMFGVLLTYPVAVGFALATHQLVPALLIHLEILVGFGLYYRWRVRKWPARDRVGALSYVPSSLIMPVTHALLTPLALFTLDCTRWETRG